MKPANDFHSRLKIRPGEELERFRPLLQDALTFGSFSQKTSPFQAELEVLDGLYALLSVDRDNFLTLAEELNRRPELIASLEKKGNGNFQMVYAFRGYTEGGAIYRHSVIQSRDLIQALMPFLILQVRRTAFCRVPDDWTAGGMVISVTSPNWSTVIQDSAALYCMQMNPLFASLLDCARNLFACSETEKEASLILKKEIESSIAKGNFSGAIDGLMIADEMSEDDPILAEILGLFLVSDNPGLLWAALYVCDRHPFQQFISRIRSLALEEKRAGFAVAQIRALRLMGGEQAFNALLDLGSSAQMPETRKLAARALAWVVDYPFLEERVLALCRSKDRIPRQLGMTALSESKYHSVFSEGKNLASRVEKEHLKRNSSEWGQT
ncbi:MAG TPA: hypothetical protein DCK76_10720 [Desulfotomaculum sp.]|nr:MAG: hypothetical protein XD84_2037 [Desulfotomaculum sp. 46_80]HAG11820.1 hypothetical protein [Desulfotomaculum sp.]HBY05225.1 hypothetical protein [Desulfotomaculum sp.]